MPRLDEAQPVEEGVAYTVTGSVQNVYASLVVLLGYAATFTRTGQWRDHARYEVGDGLVCGFRLEAEREGELDLVLYFGASVGSPVRTLFHGLFESFLAGRGLTVRRFEPLSAPGATRSTGRSCASSREAMSSSAAGAASGWLCPAPTRRSS